MLSYLIYYFVRRTLTLSLQFDDDDVFINIYSFLLNYNNKFTSI